VLLVEGPDGVGKSTFCKKLLAGLPTHVYAHFTRLPPMFDPYWGYAERASTRVVQDRFHMSEIVYAAACRRSTILPPEEYRLVDSHLRTKGMFLVLVTADPDLVKERWNPTQMFSLETTLHAAELFSRWRQEFPEYLEVGVEVDHRIHCTRDNPYPNDDSVNRVLEAYRRRLRVLESAGRRRPPSVEAVGVL
jgi:thymidylate kinase